VLFLVGVGIAWEWRGAFNERFGQPRAQVDESQPFDVLGGRAVRFEKGNGKRLVVCNALH
jgi:hypothetical protein